MASTHTQTLVCGAVALFHARQCFSDGRMVTLQAGDTVARGRTTGIKVTIVTLKLAWLPMDTPRALRPRLFVPYTAIACIGTAISCVSVWKN